MCGTSSAVAGGARARAAEHGGRDPQAPEGSDRLAAGAGHLPGSCSMSGAWRCRSPAPKGPTGFKPVPDAGPVRAPGLAQEPPTLRRRGLGWCGVRRACSPAPYGAMRCSRPLRRARPVRTPGCRRPVLRRHVPSTDPRGRPRELLVVGRVVAHRGEADPGGAEQGGLDPQAPKGPNRFPAGASAWLVPAPGVSDRTRTGFLRGHIPAPRPLRPPTQLPGQGSNLRGVVHQPRRPASRPPRTTRRGGRSRCWRRGGCTTVAPPRPALGAGALLPYLRRRQVALLVPAAGVEPARPQGAPDPEPGASTTFRQTGTRHPAGPASGRPPSRVDARGAVPDTCRGSLAVPDRARHHPDEDLGQGCVRSWPRGSFRDLRRSTRPPGRAALQPGVTTPEATPTGLEPASSSLTTRRALQLLHRVWGTATTAGVEPARGPVGPALPSRLSSSLRAAAPGVHYPPTRGCLSRAGCCRTFLQSAAAPPPPGCTSRSGRVLLRRGGRARTCVLPLPKRTRCLLRHTPWSPPVADG